MEGIIGVGIDVGGTKVLLIAIDGERDVLDELQVGSPGDLGDLAGAIVPALETFVSGLSDTTSPIALGLALPGLVDASGHLRSAPNLDAPDVEFDLRGELGTPLVAALGRRRAPQDVAFENDATAAALAEFQIGAGKGSTDVLVVSIGTGIGAGFVSGGRLIRGAHGFAGEIGHMTIDPDGPLCHCGRKGCWEQVASGPALARIANRRDRSVTVADHHGPLRGEDVVEAARQGDPGAIGVIEEFARSVAVGLVNATELLDPGTIVLGGGLVTATDVVLDPIRRAFVELSRPAQGRKHSDLVPASLGPRAAAIGAALLAISP